jgi:hypothetical protein
MPMQMPMSTMPPMVAAQAAPTASTTQTAAQHDHTAHAH